MSDCRFCNGTGVIPNVGDGSFGLCSNCISIDYTKQPRRVVQIAADKPYVIALCDDGTIWAGKDNKWKQLPAIPQDEGEK